MPLSAQGLKDNGYFGPQGMPEVFASELMGKEFSVFGDFLESLELLTRDENDLLPVDSPFEERLFQETTPQTPKEGERVQTETVKPVPYTRPPSTSTAASSSHGTPSNLAGTTERFLLVAADPGDGTPEQRLAEIINAKYEAGLLKPHNYTTGYQRFQRYMETNMSAANRQRIIAVLESFRPAFRRVAQSLTDIDLVLVEESFERLLLDYDRVFSSVGIPACLWRRTGEIVKGNKEFAKLIDLPPEALMSRNESTICIYEVMSEESAVNFWEKYANIAFDSTQKAILTSCVLKSRSGRRTTCCFSFTIRRDRYNLPYCIVGNFLPITS